MIKTVIKEDPEGTQPLDKPCQRWENYVKRDVMAVDPSRGR